MSETKVPGLNVRITSKSQLDNIKKVAITKPGQQALFLELDQVVPITDTVLLHWLNSTVYTQACNPPHSCYYKVIPCTELSSVTKNHQLLEKKFCVSINGVQHRQISTLEFCIKGRHFFCWDSKPITLPTCVPICMENFIILKFNEW